MKLQQAIPMGAIMVLTSFGCGGETVVNGFGTYGSGKLQGFVTGAGGSPVAGAFVVASFGPELRVGRLCIWMAEAEGGL